MTDLNQIEIPEEALTRSVRKYMSTLGKKGGSATLDRYGREHFVNIRKLSKGRKSTASLEIPEV